MATGPDPDLPLVFVDDLDAPVLSDGDAHHLGRVRRLAPGTPVTVGDGAGSFRRARFGRTLEIDGPVERAERAQPEISVGFALTKSGKPDLAVQKLTEVGVDRILPFVAARSVVQWDGAKAQQQVARWQVIAREACAQCRRAWLPHIGGIVAFSQVSVIPKAAIAGVGGRAPTLELPTVLVGPEGGFTPEEAGGLPVVALGPHVLRAETAAVVAGALLVGLRTGVVGSP